jgi:hypothetical protein
VYLEAIAGLGWDELREHLERIGHAPTAASSKNVDRSGCCRIEAELDQVLGIVGATWLQNAVLKNAGSSVAT